MEQDGKGLAEKTGFIVTANSSTPAANTPYTFSMEGVAYDVANQVFKREHVNTGLFKAPTSQITGIRVGRHRIRRQHGSRWRPRR